MRVFGPYIQDPSLWSMRELLQIKVYVENKEKNIFRSNAVE